jgi:Ricin-type beta-trefoil lectin domain
MINTKKLITKLFVAIIALSLVLSGVVNSESKTTISSTQGASSSNNNIRILNFKLDYTNPKFDQILSQFQKQAILKSLRKWKLQLPYNNTFTVTSLAKINEEHTIAYMWASMVNPDFDINPKLTAEDYESGDPRFIRVPFNVLLKSDNSKWTATIEKDKELDSITSQIKTTEEQKSAIKEILGTSNTNNKFTEIESKITDNKCVATGNEQKCEITNATQPKNQKINLTELDIFSTSKPTPKLTSFLDKILNFGNINASAGEFDYSWPWAGGQNWQVSGNKWHGRNEFRSLGIENGQANALDVTPPCGNNCNNQDIPVLSPITGVVTRSCDDVNNSFVIIGQMGILHLNNTNVISGGVTAKKGQRIGSIQTKNNGNFGDPRPSPFCGVSYGTHLHIKFLNYGMVVDGQVIDYNRDYSSFTSQNITQSSPQTPSLPPILPATNRITSTTNSQKVFTVTTNTIDNHTSLKLKTSTNTLDSTQKIFYEPLTRTLRTSNNKCLDGGAVWLSPLPTTTYLRAHDCHYLSNQKWYIDSSNRIHSEYGNGNLCIDSQFSDTEDSILYLYTCHTGPNQKWNTSALGMPLNCNSCLDLLSIKSLTKAEFSFNITGGNTNQSQLKLTKFDITRPWNQSFVFNTATLEIKNQLGKCLDGGATWLQPAFDTTFLRINDCHGGANQKWTTDTYNRIHSVANNNLCIDSASGNYDGSILYLYNCHAGYNQRWTIQ